MRKTILIVSILSISQFSGCSVIDIKERAKTIAAAFYEALKDKDYKRALSYVGERGLAKTPEIQWISFLRDTNEKLGGLSDYVITGWGFKTATDKGTIIRFLVTVTYEKKRWKENLILFEPPNSKEIKIIAYLTNVIKKRKKR